MNGRFFGGLLLIELSGFQNLTALFHWRSEIYSEKLANNGRGECHGGDGRVVWREKGPQGMAAVRRSSSMRYFETRREVRM